jgi:hypothetical protein
MSAIPNPPTDSPCTDDCCAPDTLPVVSHAELVARAEANPSSFLAFLLGVTPEAGTQ